MWLNKRKLSDFEYIKSDLVQYLKLELKDELTQINRFNWVFWLSTWKGMKNEEEVEDKTILAYQISLLFANWRDINKSVDGLDETYKELILSVGEKVLNIIPQKLVEIHKETMSTLYDSVSWLWNKVYYDNMIKILNQLWNSYHISTFTLNKENKILTRYGELWLECVLKSIWEYINDLMKENEEYRWKWFYFDWNVVYIWLSKEAINKIWKFLVDRNINYSVETKEINSN
jgi:hypothetical protein